MKSHWKYFLFRLFYRHSEVNCTVKICLNIVPVSLSSASHTQCSTLWNINTVVPPKQENRILFSRDNEASPEKRHPLLYIRSHQSEQIKRKLHARDTCMDTLVKGQDHLHVGRLKSKYKILKVPASTSKVTSHTNILHFTHFNPSHLLLQLLNLGANRFFSLWNADAYLLTNASNYIYV